jgi:dTDP-glucose pyrophosphorylase
VQDELKVVHRNWVDSVLLDGGKVKDVIESLNRSSSKVVMIKSRDGKFVGLITDGDLRRSLLLGNSLDDDFTSLINKNPISIGAEVKNDQILELMIEHNIHQIPVLNIESEIIGLRVIDELIATPKLNNRIIIMAGGKGTRLRPYTETCPKPMLLIGGKPMLHHIIDKAKIEGFSNFIITTHYLRHMIEDYFGNGAKFGVNISYTHEHEPLGTAGALSLITEKLDESFIVTNGDVVTDIKFSDILLFHKKNVGFATMATRPYQISHPYGVVETNGIEISSFQEKPVYHSIINVAVYVLEPGVLDLLPINEHCDMPTLLEKSKAEGKRVLAYPTHESWIDVGRVEDLIAVRERDNKSQ